MTRRLRIHLLGLLHVCVATTLALLAPVVLGHTWGSIVAVFYVLAVPAAYLCGRRSRHRADAGDGMNTTPSIGVTGTTRGLTPEQRATVNQLLGELAADYTGVRHGDCVGADHQVAELARQLGYRIVGHPAAVEDGRAFTPCDELLAPRESAARNRDIVDASGIVIGCPAAEEEWPGSGTWYTINYARRRAVPVIIVYPSGRTWTAGGAS